MDERPGTASAILAGASALLHRHAFDDISFRLLADEVGMSERNLYRYFPTRSHLLVGLARRLDVLELPFAPFTTAEELVASTRERFRAFDEAPRQALVCARAAMTSPVDPPEPDFLTHALRAMLDAERPGLNPRDHRRATATLRCFASAQFWAHARLQFGMGGDRAADVLQGVVALTLAAVSSSRAPGPGQHADPLATTTARWAGR